jgi:Nif-specific regulatory protein
MGLVQPSVTEKAMQRLMQYHWPGNIRELKNIVERALILDSDGILDADDIQMPEERASLAEISIQGMGFKEAVNSFKAQFLEDTLRSVQGSRVEAAKRLKLQRTYLSRLLKKHGVT